MRGRERERESRKKNRQGRGHQDNLTKHGVAHTPLNRKLFSIHTHTHSHTHSLPKRCQVKTRKKYLQVGEGGGEFASETGLHLHLTLTHGNSFDGRKGIAI